jgi:ABC-type amino acid transport substrate-binding protein
LKLFLTQQIAAESNCMDSKSYRVIGAIAIIVALVLSAIAFKRSDSAASASGSSDTLAKIQKTKKMSVCYAVFPPAVIKDAQTGKVSGHDVDALEVMAKQLGADIEYHESTFGNMAAAVQTGQCDIGTSLFVKIPRAAAVAFSDPVFYAGNSGLVRKGDTRFKTIADVDKPGITVAVASGESGHIYVQDHFKNAKIVAIDVESSDLSRFLLEVTSGRADIGIADANTIKLFAAQHPESEDVFANNTFDLNPDAWPIRHGDVNFLNFVNNSLRYMQSSGQWAELEKKYDAHWLHEVKTYQIK